MSLENRIAKLEAIYSHAVQSPETDEERRNKEHFVTIDGGAGYRVSVPQSAMEKCMPMIEKVYGTPSDGDGLSIPERIAA